MQFYVLKKMQRKLIKTTTLMVQWGNIRTESLLISLVLKIWLHFPEQGNKFSFSKKRSWYSCLRQTAEECGLFYERTECFQTKEKRKISKIDRCFCWHRKNREWKFFFLIAFSYLVHFSLFFDMRHCLINIWQNVETKRQSVFRARDAKLIKNLLLEKQQKRYRSEKYIEHKCLPSTLLFVLEPIR